MIDFVSWSSAPVVELGVSSMHVVDLMAQLGDVLGIELSPTLVYECVTLNGMADRLLKELAEELVAFPTPPPPVIQQHAASAGSLASR